jgi:hypothetical protein
MLSSIAAIATAITAVIGVGWAVAAVLKKRSAKKKIEKTQDAYEPLKNKMDDKERQEAQDALNDVINS